MVRSYKLNVFGAELEHQTSRVSWFLFLFESLLPPLGGPSYKLGSGVVVLRVVVLRGVVSGLTGRVT